MERNNKAIAGIVLAVFLLIGGVYSVFNFNMGGYETAVAVVDNDGLKTAVSPSVDKNQSPIGGAGWQAVGGKPAANRLTCVYQPDVEAWTLSVYDYQDGSIRVDWANNAYHCTGE